MTHYDIVNSITDCYTVMAYAAEPRSTALGATLGGLEANIDLTRTPNRIWPVDTSGHNYTDHFWHSAQFRGDCWQQQGYWSTLLGADGFNLR